MHGKLSTASLLCGSLICLLFFSGLSWGQPTQIRVVVENATIRSAPSLDGDIIGEKIPVGTVYESEKMVGEWYEIRFRNTLGVLVTGYIHQMYVEKSEPKPAPRVEEPEKPAAKPAPPAPPVPRPGPLKKAASKGDFAIMGGIVSGTLLSEMSDYSRQWNQGGLTSVVESGAIDHRIGSSGALGLSFSYLFAGGLGIQVRYDLNLSKDFPSESQSTYNINWQWATAGSGSRNKAWPATGKFSISPLSLNLILKTRGGGFFTSYVSGGISYLMGKIEARTTEGFGFSWEDANYQYIDWVDVPLAVDQSIGEIGFNIAAGFDIRLAGPMALTMETVYFGGKTTLEPWQARPGTYAGNNFPDLRWTFDESLADEVAGQVAPLEIKTSFFKVQLGIKFLF